MPKRKLDLGPGAAATHLSFLVGSLMSSLRKVKVDDRRHHQTKHHGDEESADDGNGQRLEHLRALAKRQRERQHAGNGGQRGHEDGP